MTAGTNQAKFSRLSKKPSIEEVEPPAVGDAAVVVVVVVDVVDVVVVGSVIDF